MGEHRKETRECPICHEVKAFDARHETCSRKCASKLTSIRALSEPAESVSDVSPSEPLEPRSVLEKRRLEMENSSLKERVKALIEGQIVEQRYQEFVAEIAGLQREYPKWVSEPKSGRRQAMPVAHMSDWHFDEVVDPRQVGWVNGYDRKIAERRLKRFFEKVISLCDDYLKGVDYPGIVVPVSGDMFSGNIHEELAMTNESGLCESLHHWLDPMGAGLQMLADRFGKVFVPWVVGNHPRTDKKKKSKGGVRDNFDWLLGSLLARDFARVGDQRIQFQIAEAFDNQFRIYGTSYLQSHGDQFRGGSGIAAELSPMFIGDARKRKKHQSIRSPYDVLIIGHWHSRICLPSVKCNGTGRGFSEYDLQGNFNFSEPVQSFWLNTPEHGISFEAPIYVKCPNEGWERGKTEAPAWAAA